MQQAAIIRQKTDKKNLSIPVAHIIAYKARSAQEFFWAGRAFACFLTVARPVF